MKILLVMICVVYVSQPIIMAKGNEEQRVETRYGFNEASDYATLLDVLRRSFADYQANPADKDAVGASMLAVSYAAPLDRIKLHAEFGIFQTDPSVRQKSARAIAEYLNQGRTLAQPLQQQVSDQLWNQLKTVTGQDRRVREFITHASDSLLLLGDSRGLDALLANKDFVENLKTSDGWSETTDAAAFRQLEQRYRNPADGSRADARKAEVYRLLAARKDAGFALEPSSDLQNLVQIYQ